MSYHRIGKAKLAPPIIVMHQAQRRTCQVIVVGGLKMALHPDKTAADAKEMVAGINDGTMTLDINKSSETPC